jgi:superfamily I DNA/RNA helicase
VGFASYLEDTIERYAERGSGAVGSASELTHQHVVPTATSRLNTASVRSAIASLKKIYETVPEEQRRFRDMTNSFVGKIDRLIDVLESSARIEDTAGLEPHSVQRQVQATRRKLSHFARRHAIDLSLPHDLAQINDRLSQLRADATFLRASIRPTIRSGAPTRLPRLDRFASRLKADIDRYVSKTRTCEDALRNAREAFKVRYGRLHSLARRRPSLQHIDPWLLDGAQIALVEQQFSGAMALHGTSGTGKTVVLLHRAIQEARRSPDARVLVLARHDTLVRRLKKAVQTLSACDVPANLGLSTVYDLWVKIVRDVMGEGNQHRLRDGTARVLTERTSPAETNEDLNSWLQFVRRQNNPTTVFIQQDDVWRLRQDLQRRLPPAKQHGYDPYLVVDRYILQEITYIRSAFPRSDLPDAYLRMERQRRTIPFGEKQRLAYLHILDEWEAWLRLGHVNDVVGLTWRAADAVLDDRKLEACRRTAGADHILIDELQDLSTLDLRMIRRLGPNSEAAPNAFYLVGDIEQKGSSLHLDPRMAGFNLKGKVRHVRRNYRNTQQILRAAHAIVSERDIKEEIRKDPDLTVADPELSVHAGARPVVIPCPDDSLQTRLIAGLVQDRRVANPPPSLAIVSESPDVLRLVESELECSSVPVERMWSIDDIDRRGARADSDVEASAVWLGDFDAIRGLEFDTLIVANLSDVSLPRPYVDAWRNAVRLYSTLTRARDELIVTVVGTPSSYLKSMQRHVEWIRGPGKRIDVVLSEVLELLTVPPRVPNAHARPP